MLVLCFDLSISYFVINWNLWISVLVLFNAYMRFFKRTIKMAIHKHKMPHDCVNSGRMWCRAYKFESALIEYDLIFRNLYLVLNAAWHISIARIVQRV